MPISTPIDQTLRRYRRWPYRNTALLLVSLGLLFYFADSDFVVGLIQRVGDLGYLGAFITGIFFVSTFTVAPALLVLFYLAELLNPLPVAVLAGSGAVIGDYLIFRFLKDRVFQELAPLIHYLGNNSFTMIFKTPYFAWFTPLVGAAIIASPLPDEVGVGILGVSKLKNWQFLMLSFGLNSVGILIVLLAVRAFNS